MVASGCVKTSGGSFDLIAIEPGKLGVLGVQCCRTDDQARRLDKIKSEKVWPRAKIWLGAGNRIVVHGWAKRGDRKRWTLSETEVGSL